MAERVLGWGDDDVAAARERLGAVVAQLPETSAEVDEYGNTGFFTRGSRFAWILPDHHADGRLALWCKADRHEQQAVVARDPVRYFVAPYMGRYGWIGAHLDAAHDPDWDALAELIEAAWRARRRRRRSRRSTPRTAPADHIGEHPPCLTSSHIADAQRRADVPGLLRSDARRRSNVRADGARRLHLLGRCGVVRGQRPWLATALMASAAASGSRYVPPGLVGFSVSSSSV